MPWRLTIQKFHNVYNKYWTNIYWSAAASATAANTTLDALVAAEKALYPSNVIVTAGRIDDGVPNTDIFTTIKYNQAGTRTAGSGLPLFMTARVDFSIAAQGRPARKYLRSVINEEDIVGYTLQSGVITALTTYGTAVTATDVCDPQGSNIEIAAVWPQAQMRQERRGSKKKVTP